MLTLRVYDCPECKKRRLYRPEDYTVILDKVEKELPSGQKISHYKDVCERCMDRIIKLYYLPKKSDAKKVLSALEDNRQVDSDKSLEELL